MKQLTVLRGTSQPEHIMQEHRSIPPTSGTGKERWNRSVAYESIIYRTRSLIHEATAEPAVNFPEFHDWCRDLRRGRTNILGGFFRLTDGIKRRGMGQRGRCLALGLLALAHEYVDLVLPETAAPSPNAEAVPFGPRIYRNVQDAARRMA